MVTSNFCRGVNRERKRHATVTHDSIQNYEKMSCYKKNYQEYTHFYNTYIFFVHGKENSPIKTEPRIRTRPSPA